MSAQVMELAQSLAAALIGLFAGLLAGIGLAVLILAMLGMISRKRHRP